MSVVDVLSRNEGVGQVECTLMCIQSIGCIKSAIQSMQSGRETCLLLGNATGSESDDIQAVVARKSKL